MRTKRLHSYISWLLRVIWINLVVAPINFVRYILPHPQVKKWDRFLVVEDIPTHALTHWKAPATFGFACTIPKGTILVAYHDSARVSVGFGCVPENAKEFEKNFVPESDRTDPKYNGYSFVMVYADIGKRLEKL